MKNQERWDFAQKYASKEMMRQGFLLVSLSFLGFFVHLEELFNILLGLILMLISFIFLFVRVERALKRNFDQI